MMDIKKNQKIERVLGIYTKLMNGFVVNKREEAYRYNVNERSIQRDIDDIRNFLELDVEDSGVINDVIYDRKSNGYHLEYTYKMKLTNSETLAICKILLDSRAFTKKEMESLIDKLVQCCVPKNNQELIIKLIRNEEFHYVELRHKTQFIDTLWDVGQAISQNRVIVIDYHRTKDDSVVKRRIQPVSIMFSEYYFYVAAFIDDEDTRKNFDVINDSFPTIYRVDRIRKLRVLDERFHIPYSSRFEEGEFRKRIQFMYGGKLQRIKFDYKGNSIESILDRLPTAKIIAENDGVYTVSAEVFGKGIDMWIRSQGDMISNIEYR